MRPVTARADLESWCAGSWGPGWLEDSGKRPTSVPFEERTPSAQYGSLGDPVAIMETPLIKTALLRVGVWKVSES